MKVIYELKGIVEHSGTLNGGHYVSYVKKNNKWFYISDSSYQETTESNVLRAEAYMAFYDLIL